MRWTVKKTHQPEVVQNLQKKLNVHPLIAMLLEQRGVQTFEEARDFFRPTLEQLHDPFLMKDMDKAVQRVAQALENQERILVFGDYDVDGTTAVALMASYLRSIGAEVDTYIPDRYAEGYGISTQGIDYAEDNEMTLIIALDCGIKSIDKIEYAQSKNIDFVICDHHLPGKELPDAVAVLDPKRTDCLYPYKELCGCGVGFKLVQALGTLNGQTILDLIPYLDLVATAIAADIVPITGENRVLAYFGLQVINQDPRPGLLALKKMHAKTHFTITDVVFKIAPKINAAGRIKHGNFAVKLLTEFNLKQAEKVATEIDVFNTDRKELDQKITKEALSQITELNEENTASTVVYSEGWHKGVIGIVASRLIENYYRPTLVFTKSGDYLVASARSVKGFDMYEALEACSEHLVQFGGHTHAAGLTLLPENFQDFKDAFEVYTLKNLPEEAKTEELEIDAIVDFNELTDRNLRILKQFEPHGPGNMSPVFLTHNVFDIGTAKCLGKENEHLSLFVKQNNSKGYSAIGFRMGEMLDVTRNLKLMQLVYTLSENEWKDKVTLQLQLKDLRVI